jgi:hypothetical protein
MGAKRQVSVDREALMALWPTDVTIQQLVDKVPARLRPRIAEQLGRVPELLVSGKTLLLTMHLRGAVLMLAANIASIVADNRGDSAPPPAPGVLWDYLQRHGILLAHERAAVESVYAFLETQEVEAIRADGPSIDLVFAFTVGLLRLLAGRCPAPGAQPEAGVDGHA